MANHVDSRPARIDSRSEPVTSATVAVIIPARNEEESIPLVLSAIPADCAGSVIVVDNGSVDATAEVARSHGAVVVSEPRRGYGYACLAGIHEALRADPDIFVFLDGDFSDYPEEMTDLLDAVREGNDLVIGSRTIGRREPGALLPQALCGNRLATFLIRIFWGYRFTDLGPFRAITTEGLKRLNMRDKTYGWTVEMQVKAAKLGMVCTEVPVRYRKRIGVSKVTGTVSGTIKASWKILFTIFRYLFVKL